ncbi:hypothetical protein [Streptococcus pluranimalium]|uniref:hypothetical protein n=1 Tax=Streptococcus pluranimalium TaxID=82348 RepID=UPI003F67C24C
MAKNKYYVSAKCKELDLGMEIEAENAYMAAIEMSSLLWNEFNIDDVIITDSDLMGMEVQDGDY